ncbi:DNA damage response protein kinase DUN1 [Nakaseomyces bracarensis]|uniref:DNA damage response protein kinase DUN1 n=1 Tax=Nakaseomyces bracarensis TaxID=273131 RepID=A0ABR4NV69_9SACH
MSLTVKRNNSSDIQDGNKRQRDVDGDRAYQVVATLVSLIPGKEQKFEVKDKSLTSVGRSRSCDIVLQEPDISTTHCEMYIVDMQLDNSERKLINIVDKSRNGTYINGNKLMKKDYVLKNGDRVVFGKRCSFLFKYAASTMENLDSEGDVDDVDTTMEQDQNADTSAVIRDGDSVFKKPQFSFTSSQSQVRKLAKLKPISFFDKYLLGKDLGSGHYAVVKEAKNKKTGETVAVKIFHPQQNDDQKKNKQFREETTILMKIHHPNIVNLLDSFVEPMSKTQIQKYLVLEKIDDGELFDRIVRKTSLPENESKAIFKQILTGLKYLHSQNIIHRDIKPENILLNIKRRSSPDEIQMGPWDPDEIDIQVKIADFGLAKFTGEMQFTNTLCGTPSYVAPEVLVKRGYSSKVDLWSAGVILYVCLCGFPPFSDQLGPPSLKEQILQAKYAFYSPYWDNINDAALHLISNLLVLDSEARYDVDTALNHPWLEDVSQIQVSHELKRLQIEDNRVPKTYSELSSLQ